jgi:hypothetical protein
MGFFGLLFLIAVFWMVIRAWRKSERCVAMGPPGYGPGWYGGERQQDYPQTRASAERTQQDYIDALERRLSELEERLDFTERLLAGRKEPA